ncbi:MAG TPA: TIGR02300 family protein [Rhodospirillales bacterium]|nr:TIGR02300 family protein [Rhodospirillales bacterium]
MAVKDLGTKLTCRSCEAKFYDLNKKKPVCPKCDKDYVAVKTRTRRAAAKSEKTNEVMDSEKIEKQNITETVAVAVADATTEGENSILSDDSVENIDMPDVEEAEEAEEDNSTLIEDTSDIGDDDDDIAGVIVNSDTSPEIV